MEGFMEVELMVTKRDDDNRRPTDRQGEYRAICLWKMDWQSFAISTDDNGRAYTTVGYHLHHILSSQMGIKNGKEMVAEWLDHQYWPPSSC